MDKVQSIYQGRPARLREADQNVPIEFLDDFGELEQFHTITYAEVPQQLNRLAYSVSSFQQLCKLSVIMDRILMTLYSEQTCFREPVELLSATEFLHSSLTEWLDNLPGHLVINLSGRSSNNLLPHTLSLL